jgi:hypothetical protein
VDLRQASPVKEEDLKEMSVDIPRPPKPKKITDEKKPDVKIANKKKRPKGGKPSRNISDSKRLKNLYSKAFRRTTMTVGCWTGCLNRATSFDGEQAKAIAHRIDLSVHLLNRTRSYMYKALMLFITTNASGGESGDLDLLLQKKYGRTVLRNLAVHLLNGKASGRGGKTENEGTKRSQVLGESIYDQLIETIGTIEPINQYHSISLSIPLKQMVHAVHDNIRTHFRRLPAIIAKKVNARS